MAQSIRAVLNSHAESIRFLPDAGEPFSIKDWIKRDNGEASILFITAQYAHLDMSRSLLTLWMNIAINTIMTLKHTRQLRTWFIFDELAALHQLPALDRKSVVQGKSVSVRVDLGGSRIIKQTIQKENKLM